MKNIIRNFLTIIIFVWIFGCTSEPFQSLKLTTNNYVLSNEISLNQMNHINSIDSLFNSGYAGFFKGKNDIDIFYSYYLQDESERGAIVISSGRTEAVVKYKEVIFDLFNNGYSVYIWDHRGQGFSDRMLPDHDMGYIDEFQFYIDDMKYFYDKYVIPNNHSNIYLLAHSMGGAIGVTYLEQFPDDFNSAAFSSPMLGLSFPSCLVVSILSGDNPEYAPGNDNYEKSIVPFEENDLTNSKIRYQLMEETFQHSPKARLGGATYQWVNKSCDQFDIIFENLEKIETPLMLFSGSEESIVSSSAHNNFIAKLKAQGKDAQGYYVEGAKHELLIEKDNVRNSVIATVLNFFSEQNQN